MARAVGLIAVALGVAGCGSEPASCTDLADWRIELTRGAPIRIAIASDGSLYAALGDSGDGVQLGGYELHGGHLAHLSADGEILAVVPAHEGDSGFGAAAMVLDAGDDLLIAWQSTDDTTLACYTPHLELRWTMKLAGTTQLMDVAPSGESGVITRPPGGDATLSLIDETGALRWADSVSSIGITRLVFSEHGDALYAWVGGTDGSLRYTFEPSQGFVVESTPFTSSPTIAMRDGGYIAQTFDMLSRADGQGGETWYRAFTGPTIGLPIASTTGDILLPVTSADGKYVLVIDQDSGDTRTVRSRCGSTVLGAADRDAYYGIGLGGDDPGSISRFPLR